ncbi:hypothetical protein GMST_43870 [Geomonas silvestris]|uniref:LysM domain-containing protein n=1 Tax=Geomonas silvestris TaxID=2740184 RepID=A0A6V8MQ63_9BACT|nr:hypothetical protein [Geomonas silvestris]GFO62062.1 hypothetical protein GMST_43870 [Geomonas silvestris]
MEILQDFGLSSSFYVKWSIYLLGGLLVTIFAVMVYSEMHSDGKGEGSHLVIKQEPSVKAPVAVPGTTKLVESAAREEASKVVKRGDTLARLISQVYGHVDAKLITLVKKANPTIDNENLIIEGRRIVFPVNKK